MRKRNYFWALEICFVVCIMSFGGTAFGAENAGLLPKTIKEFKFDNVKITWGGEYRLRYEYKKDFDFDDDVNDKDGYVYARTRFNVGANINDKVLLFFEGLDGREWDSDVSPKPQKDDFDLHQLYFLLSKPNDLPVSLKIGRQELSYGAKRLVHCSAWPNLMRSFDAFKLTYNPNLFDVDLFWGNVVQYLDRHFNDGKFGEHFFGVYSTFKGIKGSVFDLYALNLIDKHREVTGEDQQNGDSERVTLGTRGEGKLPCYDALGYGYEFAWQLGDKATDTIKAYAWHGDINYTFKNCFAQPVAKIEYNFASGDDKPHDGKSETFIPLFQSTHEPYGIIDFFRWQNVKEVACFLDFTPIKDRLKGSLQYHRFYLDETEDAWYNASGKKIRKGTSADVSDYVGDELDVVMTCKPLSFLTLEGGYAHFFCGEYVKDTGSSDDADWVYFQTVVTF
ncbi:MAG: alginate export family protein [Thermodesulfobacteriota bacterium]|nr:MAG: alginate export family protein [Thermodesulfobacteriota bacterium]